MDTIEQKRLHFGNINMNNRIKQIYVLAVHPESDSVFICKESEWNSDQNTLIQECNEIDRFDDIDFANYEGQKYAEEHHCGFTEYEAAETIEPEIISVDKELLSFMQDKLDTKTRVALEFDLKFCGRSFVDRNNQRIDPINVMEVDGDYKLKQ